MNFPITFLGNKKQDIKFFKSYLPPKEDLKIVCEPFAGSFAVSRCIYPDIEKIVCGDNDEDYKRRLKNIMTDVSGYEIEKKNIHELITPSKTSTPELKKILERVGTNKYFVYTDFSTRGMVKRISEKYNHRELIPIYNKIEWHDDFRKVMNLYKDTEKCFIFLDPPYFLSHNKNYHGDGYVDNNGIVKDGTAFFIDILEYFKTSKAKLMMILNKSAIIEHIFKDFIKGEYLKTYGISRRKEYLLIITNYIL
jgi:site-specific DNA-adenine methylase